jgi:glycosyltransferase involved in cell wall biosynthesis
MSAARSSSVRTLASCAPIADGSVGSASSAGKPKPSAREEQRPRPREQTGLVNVGDEDLGRIDAGWPAGAGERPDGSVEVLPRFAGRQTEHVRTSHAEALRDRAAMLPHVHWMGPLDDLGPFYADLDAFVLPSSEPEPFGLVMAEALASGVPVTATDHGGPPEALGGRPERGRLVPPRDPVALAEAIRDLADPPPWAELFDEVARRGR